MLILWMIEQFGRRSLLDQFTIVYHDDAIGHITGKFHFMGDDQHGRSFPGKGFHHAENFTDQFWVEGGRIQYPVKGATIIGNGPDALRRVSMIGNDMKLDTGVGVCGKDGQSVPVGVGQPTLRIDRITVGGAA